MRQVDVIRVTGIDSGEMSRLWQGKKLIPSEEQFAKLVKALARDEGEQFKCAVAYVSDHIPAPFREKLLVTVRRVGRGVKTFEPPKDQVEMALDALRTIARADSDWADLVTRFGDQAARWLAAQKQPGAPGT